MRYLLLAIVLNPIFIIQLILHTNIHVYTSIVELTVVRASTPASTSNPIGEPSSRSNSQRSTLKDKLYIPTDERRKIMDGYKNARRQSVFQETQAILNPRQYATYSLGVLALDNPLRRLMITAMESKWFERCILFVIFLNSITIGMIDNTVVNGTTGDPIGVGYSIGDLTVPAVSIPNQIIAVSNIIFTVCFTIECVIKVIAMGFVSAPGAYLKDPWNWLDFTVTVTSLLDSVPGIPNISVLKLFRVLRPLRSVHSMPGMRALVESLFKALPHLGNVAIVLCFLCLLFMIFGVQLWRGMFYYRCRLTPYPIALPEEYIDTYRWAQFGMASNPTDPLASEWMYNFLTNRTAFPWCSASLSPPPGVTWTKDTSPWSTPQHCAWPIDQWQLATFPQYPNYTFGVESDPYGMLYKIYTCLAVGLLQSDCNYGLTVYFCARYSLACLAL